MTSACLPVLSVLLRADVAAGSEGAWNYVDLNWMTYMLAPDPRLCNHVRYVNAGQRKYFVYGAICDKWQASGALWGPGEPTTSEENSPGGNARVNYFVDNSNNPSAIFWDGTHGAHIVYGGIYATYVWAGQDANPSLGRPTSDEGPTSACSGGRVQSFEFGEILWCNGDGILIERTPAR